ncbi:MAG: prolyl oligopeptidase family serine peptidase [Pseudonocardiaceae bacterium]
MTGTDAGPVGRSSPAEHPSAPCSPARYPSAQRLELVEQLHGRAVPDPYRWLEDLADPRTVTWAIEQDRLARAVLDALPERTAVARKLERLLSTGWVSVPVWRNGRAFFTRREPDGEHAVLCIREPGPDGATTERVLLDVIALDPSGLTTLDLWSPGHEGDRLVYQISAGGDEESTLHVIDVATGKLLDGPIERCRYSPIGWLPGGAELYYVRRLAPHQVPDGEKQFHRGVRRLGTAPRDSVWIADLHGPGELVPVLSNADAVRCTAWVARGGRLSLLTTLDAPRWRLCVADPTELDWLLSYSPYHHVRPGTNYPAVLFTVFDSDTRVDPLHARKMCAALQYATAADPAQAPVLIRREVEGGHAARAVSRTVALITDQLCFLAQYTGLDLEAVRAG